LPFKYYSQAPMMSSKNDLTFTQSWNRPKKVKTPKIPRIFSIEARLSAFQRVWTAL